MRSKLNPDGDKIRILCIQRGWTQEQLAEIAGVSPRTIQRAENASCAAFETLRAIAGAFETDFHQLLRPEAHTPSGQAQRIADQPHTPDPGVEIEPIPIEPSKPPVRRVWTMTLIAGSTLVLGLISGAILTTHFNKGGKPHSPEPPKTAVASQTAGKLQKPVLPLTVTRQGRPGKKVPSQPANAAIPQYPGMTAGTEFKPEEHPLEVSITPDPVLRDSIQRPQASASLDFPLHSRTLLSERVLPEAPVPSGTIPVVSGNPSSDEPELGAVRQAVDLAAKKTGTFVSRVGTSLKRVF
jgi:transcriptional regulator with XRE-family HTH domain